MLGCRKDIVGVAHQLQQLDGTPVLKQERVFLQRLHSRKLSRDVSFKSTSSENTIRARNMLVLPATNDGHAFCHFLLGLGSAVALNVTGHVIYCCK